MDKEYQICCGNYRSFIVRAKSKKQAKERFDEASKMEFENLHQRDIYSTLGFTLKDVTNIILRKVGNVR